MRSLSGVLKTVEKFFVGVCCGSLELSSVLPRKVLIEPNPVE